MRRDADSGSAERLSKRTPKRFIQHTVVTDPRLASCWTATARAVTPGRASRMLTMLTRLTQKSAAVALSIKATALARELRVSLRTIHACKAFCVEFIDKNGATGRLRAKAISQKPGMRINSTPECRRPVIAQAAQARRTATRAASGAWRMREGLKGPLVLHKLVPNCTRVKVMR